MKLIVRLSINRNEISWSSFRTYIITIFSTFAFKLRTNFSNFSENTRHFKRNYTRDVFPVTWMRRSGGTTIKKEEKLNKNERRKRKKKKMEKLALLIILFVFLIPEAPELWKRDVESSEGFSNKTNYKSIRVTKQNIQEWKPFEPMKFPQHPLQEKFHDEQWISYRLFFSFFSKSSL